VKQLEDIFAYSKSKGQIVVDVNDHRHRHEGKNIHLNEA
jgi:hypothetical protein